MPFLESWTTPALFNWESRGNVYTQIFAPSEDRSVCELAQSDLCHRWDLLGYISVQSLPRRSREALCSLSWLVGWTEPSFCAHIRRLISSFWNTILCRTDCLPSLTSRSIAMVHNTNKYTYRNWFNLRICFGEMDTLLGRVPMAKYTFLLCQQWQTFRTKNREQIWGIISLPFVFSRPVWIPRNKIGKHRCCQHVNIAGKYIICINTP